jgi:5-(carboxyamino)imidazole ribonucleotide mutase
MKKPIVGIIMGSDSDLTIMKEAATVLDEFQVPYELLIISAHRTPESMVTYAKEAHTKGLQVIIAGAGGAAHLPGMTAALTPLPVIGVPIGTKALKGLDSLLSIAQMPAGVPVATVAINGAKNAALLAMQILGASDKTLRDKMIRYKATLKKSVLDKTQMLEGMGWEKYLESK